LDVLCGGALDSFRDAELDSIVREAAEALRGRLCVLCLLLRRSLVVRAASGTAPDVMQSLRTAPESAPCTLVVRAATAITTAAGGEAYLGIPVELSAVVVGALAVYGGRRGEFDARERELLERLALACGARLTELAARPVARIELVTRAARGTFGELRKAAVPLDEQLEAMRCELETLSASANHLRVGAIRALDRLRSIHGTATTLRDQALALERLLPAGEDCMTVAELVRGSDLLAHHHTKLAGGVRWQIEPANDLVGAEPAACTAVIVNGLCLVAERTAAAGLVSGLDGAVKRVTSEIEVRIASSIDRSAFAACASVLAEIAHGSELEIGSSDQGIRIVMPAG
jgi:hypothetical protein